MTEIKHGRLVRKPKGGIDAVCPYCKKHNPIGVWAAAHLNEVLKGPCKSCGKVHTIGGSFK